MMGRSAIKERCCGFALQWMLSGCRPVIVGGVAEGAVALTRSASAAPGGHASPCYLISLRTGFRGAGRFAVSGSGANTMPLPFSLE